MQVRKRSRAAFFCLALTGMVVACDVPGLPDDVVVLETADPLPLMPPSEDSSAWLGIGWQMALRGQRVAIIDRARQALHLIDLETGDWRVVGSRGSGPHEFGALQKVAFIDGDLWTTDSRNARLARISWSGAHGASTPLQMPLTFARDERGWPIIRSLEETHLLQAVDSDGEPRLIGAFDSLPDGLTPQAAGFHQPDFVSLEPIGRGVFLLAENHTGRLWIGRVRDGELILDEVSVPAVLLDAFRQRKFEIDDAFAGWAPIYNGLHFDGGGHVWVRCIPVGILGFRIDLDERRVDTVVRSNERSVLDSALRNDTLYALTETTLMAYPLMKSDNRRLPGE
jgi:hypothetical protein